MFARGNHLRPLTVDGWRLATPICYEAILPSLVRDMVRNGDPHLLVNLSNDAWFGNTQGPWIHLRLAQLRAIEHRRYVVRATNSGVSAVIDRAGRLVASTGVDTRDNLRAEVLLSNGSTLYGRLGDWPGLLAFVVTLFSLVRPNRVTTLR
jgi:apolipoprotein N-acyltransferase